MLSFRVCVMETFWAGVAVAEGSGQGYELMQSRKLQVPVPQHERSTVRRSATAHFEDLSMVPVEYRIGEALPRNSVQHGAQSDAYFATYYGKADAKSTSHQCSLRGSSISKNSTRMCSHGINDALSQ